MVVRSGHRLGDATNVMARRLSVKVEQEAQTAIRTYPFLLDSVMDKAVTLQDHKIQTEISVRPNDMSRTFHSMLAFLPYQDIAKNALRVIELPRKQRLQFATFSKVGLLCCKDVLAALTLVDDDALSEYASIMLTLKQVKPISINKDAQTEFVVRPHILDAAQVAYIRMDNSTQTIECDATASSIDASASSFKNDNDSAAARDNASD